MQTFDGSATYPYGTSAGKVCKTELLQDLKIKIWNNFDVTIENKTKHNPHWLHSRDHMYRILITGDSG